MLYQLQKLSAIFSHKESFRHKPLYGVLGKLFCSKYSPTVPLCALGLFMLAGWDPKQLDKVSGHCSSHSLSYWI